MSTALLALSREMAAAVRKHAGSVVAVHGNRRFPSSGIVWQPGVVVTAEHTLREQEEIRVTVDGGGAVTARVAGRDPSTDVAVLRLESENAPAAVDRGPASGAEAGMLVLAVGRSPNAGPVASMGVISAVSGPWRTWRGGSLEQYIRLDVGMYPGSSGALVVDANGAVTGMATAFLSRVAGLAIPAAALDRVTGELLAKGRIAHAYLGVGLQPVELPEHQIQGGARGLLVITVEPGGPAANAGILVGDVLTALNGAAARDTGDVQGVLEKVVPGATVGAAMIRGGKREEIRITVAERPSRGR